MPKWSYVYVLAFMMMANLIACQTDDDSLSPTIAPKETLSLAVFTPIPTVNILPTNTKTPTPTLTPTATVSPSATAPPSPTPTEVIPTATLFDERSGVVGTSAPLILRQDHYLLARPIARSDFLVDWVDRTYPYGGTQFGAREVHLGVEFVNPRFTPVLAAADGVVYYAGDDSQNQFGPSLDYYGLLVIIEHPLLIVDGAPLYTLYGHLQSVSVEAGQRVERGDRVGQIGDSGIAIGPHLHFEVRVQDPTDWRNTRNPELWLAPYPGFGTLAGRVRDSQGNYLTDVVLLVRGDAISREAYTYGGSEVNRDPVWDENFTLGDLPEGQYTVIISTAQGKLRFSDAVTIQAGQTTWLDIQLKD